jgi:hypothetical protein
MILWGYDALVLKKLVRKYCHNIKYILLLSHGGRYWRTQSVVAWNNNDWRILPWVTSRSCAGIDFIAVYTIHNWGKQNSANLLFHIRLSCIEIWNLLWRYIRKNLTNHALNTVCVSDITKHFAWLKFCNCVWPIRLMTTQLIWTYSKPFLKKVTEYHNNSNNILHICTNSKNNNKMWPQWIKRHTVRKVSAQASLLYMYTF